MFYNKEAHTKQVIGLMKALTSRLIAVIRTMTIDSSRNSDRQSS